MDRVIYFLSGMVFLVALALSFFEYDVVIPGQAKIEVSTKNRPLQHLEGGVVGEIRIKQGDYVHAGEVLAIINSGVQVENEVELRAEREAVRIRLDRLISEEKGQTPIFESNSGGVYALFAANEKQLGEARKRELQTILNQYQDRISQSNIKIEKNNYKEKSISSRIELLQEKYESSKRLLTNNLITKFEVLEVEGELEGLKSSKQDLVQENLIERKVISELKNRKKEVLDGFKNSLAEDIRDAQVLLERIDQRLNPLLRRAERAAVVSPVDGVVKTLNIVSIGDVIAPGAVIAEVVPIADGYIANVSVSPADIVEIFPGQGVSLVLDAYNKYEFGSILGTVESVSVDTVLGEAGSGEVYRVMVQLGPLKRRRNDSPINLMAGMSGTAYFKNGTRPLIHYILGKIYESLAANRTAA
jgi:adhesin transport system membrane fusion protein